MRFSSRFSRWTLMAAAAIPCFAQNPVVVENDWVRVVRAANIPSQLSRPHVHLVNRVMVHLDRGTLRIDNKETGVAREIPFRAGEVRWDPRVGLHTSENIGGTAIRIVEIELKDNPPRDQPAKLPAPAARFRADMENGQVRILRTTLAANETLAAGALHMPAVAVRLADGFTQWLAENSAGLSNSTAQTAEWVLVELK
jgi:hypothetical protein